MVRTKKNIVLTILSFLMIISLALTGFGLSESKKVNADGVTTITISSVSYVGFDSGNAAIGLYRITLSNTLPGTATTSFASPNTIVQKQDGNSAADIRGENTNNTLIVRVPYGRVKSGAASIDDLDDGTVVTIKSGLSFTLSCGSVQFATDWEATYHTGDSVLTFSAKAVSLSISSVSFVANESASVGLYRVNLASAMSSSATTTFASPNTVVQKQDGNSAADIRGENTNNTLIVRIPYGRVKSGASSISDLDNGTLVTIKAGVAFTLSNGTYVFDEDYVLEYTTGASSFVTKVVATMLSVSSVSYLGLENNNTAIGLYRVNLASAMDSNANTTYVSPRTLAVQSSGAVCADVRGENTNNSIIIRMLYGLIKSGASSISNLDNGTLVTIKAGISFTLNNGTFEFDEDFVLEYTTGASSFVKKVDVTTLSISSVSFISNESAAIGLYRINLASAMSSSADTTNSPRGLTIQSNGVAVADIRGENTNNSLVVRMPYGLIKSGASSIDSLNDDTIVTIKAGVRFTLSNGVFAFDEDFVLMVNKVLGCFVEYAEKTYTEISFAGTITYYQQESAAIDIYKIELDQTLSYATNNAFATVGSGYGLELPNGSKAGYIKGAGENDYLLLRVCYAFFDSTATGTKATNRNEIDNEQGLVVKGGENFTFDGVNYYYFDQDYNFYFAQSTHLFYYVATDTEVSLTSCLHLRDVDNPVASDYSLNLGSVPTGVEANTQASALFNGGNQGIVRNADDTSYCGYMFAQGTNGVVYIRIYAALVADETDLDAIEDGTIVLLKGNVKYTFDGLNFFHLDRDYKVVFNKYMNNWYACKTVSDVDYAYNFQTKIWEELNPVIYVKYQDEYVTNRVSLTDDSILVVAGSDGDSFICEGYDLTAMYKTASFDISSALVNDKFVEGDYEIEITFTDNIGVSTSRTVTLLVRDCSYVTYTFEDNSQVYDYYADGTDYTVAPYSYSKSRKTFLGWQSGDALYYSGDVINDASGSMTFTAFVIDYKMADGAYIRVDSTTNTSGIKFRSMINKNNFDALIGLVSSVNYGTLILPLDSLECGQAPNLEDFEAGSTILKIRSTVNTVENGYINYYGGIIKIYEDNYTRSFAGRGYMTITYKNGETRTFYTDFDSENVRSVKYVALMAQKDTPVYSTYTAAQKTVIDGYTKKSVINLIDYSEYSSEKYKIISLNYLPDLDTSNNYDNDYNRFIISDIKDAGFNVVSLTGFTYPTSAANITAIKTVISLFDEYGIKSIVFAGNHHNTVNSEYDTYADLPDFTDCEGFLGFYFWDEPTTTEQFETLVEYAEMFKTVYGVRDYQYINDVGYVYVDDYCKNVLANLPDDMERYISTYSYPIKTDGTLQNYFLSNLASLKLWAMEYDAKSTIILQSSCWPESSDGAVAKVPSLAELRLQVYAALAFGIDDISFFTYAPLTVNDGNGISPVDKNGSKNDVYYNLKNVIGEINSIDEILNWFKWQGVILNVESGSDDEQAYNNAINGYKPGGTDVGAKPLGDYLLNASDTNLLSSVSNGAYDENYILGVFLDNNGNEAYVLSNYNDVTESRTQKVTFTFSQNVTKVYLYRNGVKSEVSVVNNTLDVMLSNGEGVFILPAQIG